MAEQDYVWTPINLVNYPSIQDVNISPSGQRLLVAIQEIRQSCDGRRDFGNRIVILDNIDSDRRSELPCTLYADSPSWHPDEQHVSFLGIDTQRGKMGIWLYSVDDQETWSFTDQLADFNGNILDHRWTPDGNLIFTQSTGTHYASSKSSRRFSTPEHAILESRSELYMGFVHSANGRIDLQSVIPLGHALTGSIVQFDISSDASFLAFTETPTPGIRSWSQSRLKTLDLLTGIVKDFGLVASLSEPILISPDSKWVACAVGNPRAHRAYETHMVVFSEDRAISLSQVPDGQPTLVGWSSDSQSVFVANANGISTQVFSLSIDSSPAELIYSGDKQFFAAHSNQRNRLVFAGQDFHEINSVYLLDTSCSNQETTRQLTKLVQPSCSKFVEGPMPQVMILSWPSNDGFEIEGILYLPETYRSSSGVRLPLLLHVHGGPPSVFQREYTGTPYYYSPAAFCERGIAVLRCNPPW